MRILNLEPDNYNPAARSILSKLGKVTNGPFKRAELKREIEKYDILIVRLGHKIDKEILNNAARLKAIVSATTGLNHIDLKEAEMRNIAVLSLKGEREFLDQIYATAEHTIGLILSLLRNIPAACEEARKGNWNRDAFRGVELHGKTLGIIGYGRLGSKVAHYAQGFGMRVIANDIRPVTGITTKKYNGKRRG